MNSVSKTFELDPIPNNVLKLIIDIKQFAFCYNNNQNIFGRIISATIF